MRLRPESVGTGGYEKDYRQEREKNAYTPDGVQEANTRSQTVARSKAYLSGGGVIDAAEAQRRVSMETVGYAVNPVTGDAVARGVDPRSARPATQVEVIASIERKFPSVTAAARASGLSEAEILTHVNFATAVDAATQIATSYNPRRQAQIFNTMGPDMQGLVGDILNTWWQDSQQKATVVEDASTGNAVTDFAGKLWAYSGSPIFDFLWAANQLTMRGVTTLAYSGLGTNMSIPDAWQATAPGQYNAEGLEVARREYGTKTVDTILAIKQAGASGDDDAVGALYKKYSDAGDVEALALMDAALFGINADQQVQDAITYVTSLETGNMGNVAFWSLASMFGQTDTASEMTNAANSAFYTGVRDTTNVVGTFAFDPTLLAGKAVRGYQAARYGLRLLAPGKIDDAFKNQNVRRFFDTLGEGFKKADDAQDLGQKAQVLNSLRSQYKGWFDAAGLDALRTAGVYSADDALEYFRSAENVRLLMQGQTARRGGQVLIPHMLKATAQAKRASLLARGLTYDRNAGAKIDEIFGPGVSQMLPEDAIPVIIQRLSATDGDQFVGRMLSDFVFADGTAKRTFIGRVLGRDGAKYGYKRQGGVRARAERLSRTMAHMPQLGDGLWITDARDAQKVRDLMLWAGMPKYWADVSADMWRRMDPGQRLRFASGMGRSAGYALGVDIVDPVSGKSLVDELVMGLRSGELYVPDQQDLVSLRGKANKLANDELNALAQAKAAQSTAAAASVVDETPAWPGGPALFHGTSERFPNDSLSEVFDIYQSQNMGGAGLYSTVARDIADTGYQAKGAGKNPITYMLRWTGRESGRPTPSILDGDAPAPEFVRNWYRQQIADETSLVTFNGYSPDNFVAVLDNPDSSYIDLIRAFRRSLADDAEGVTRTYAEELVTDLNFVLRDNGIDVVKHVGGRYTKKATKEHDVYIWVNPNDVEVVPAADNAASTSATVLPEGVDPALVQAALADDGIEVFINKKGNVSIRNTPAYKKLRSQLVQKHMAALKADAPWVNPSRAIDQQVDATNGLYAAQMTERIAMPDLVKLEQFSMRQSYLTALLGLNPYFTRAVDLWTLGTLAGPRFQLRNGLEDAGLYALTDGSWKGYRAGRLYATAKREATQRPKKALTDTARGEKLGIVKTSSRWLGDQMPKSLQGLIWPNLDPADIAAANGLAAKGDRSGLVTLINKAMLRGLAKYTRGRVLDADTVRYLDEAGEFGGFFSMMDEVSETARHLADGIPPGVTEVDEIVVNGTPMRVMTADKTYQTLKVKRGDPRAVKDWWANLSLVLHGDRGKGQAAVARIRRYHAAKLSGNTAKQQEIVKDFAQWIEEKAPWVLEQSGIAATEGVESFARRNLDDVLRLFTSKSGGFNEELYKKIRRVDVDDVTGEERVTFALWDDGPNGPEFRVFEQDLAEMKARPQTVLDVDGVKIPVSPKMPLDQATWAAMGRSLARMTREPIFVSNYLDARKALEPFQARIAAQLGDEAAKKWAVEAAYERAYATSMAFIDNPTIRSQMAWNVRNIARFYRAMEDFNRRILRVAKYQPEAFQRLHLTWRVMDDTGFVWTDEYGDKYFIWPGSRMMMQSVNKITSLMGLPVAEAGLPMVFGSKVTMVTPSADPNSWFPTMSSPYASLALRPLLQLVPGLSSLEQEIFGEYSTSSPIWQSILPPNVMRPLELIAANMAGEDSREQFSTGSYASSARSAIQAYAAAGLFDESKQYSPAEISKMRRTIDVAALDIMALKTVLSPAMLASFQVQPDTVTEFARSVGVDGMREAFVQVLKANDGDIDAAYVQWLSANPGRSIFTVSANTNGDEIGNYGPFRETVQWIEANSDIVEKHPVGAAFFAPQDGTQNLAAWSYLRAMGAKVPKTVESYFNEVATAQGYGLYRVYKTQYDQAVAEGRKDEVQGAWDAARADLYARFPMLQSRIQGELSTTDFPSRSDNMSAMDDYRGAISMVDAKGGLDERGFYAQQVVSMYDEARSLLAQVSTTDPQYDKHREQVRDMWLRMIDDMKSRYVGDRQWESLLYTASGALGFRVQI